MTKESVPLTSSPGDFLMRTRLSQMYLLAGGPTSPIKRLDPQAELGTSSFNRHSFHKHFVTIWMHDDSSPMSQTGSQVLGPELLLSGSQITQLALRKYICATGDEVGFCTDSLLHLLFLLLLCQVGESSYMLVPNSSASHIPVCACSGHNPPAP